MMSLSDILYQCRIKEVVGSINTTIEHIAMDSREVQANGLFIAIRGTQVDGHNFIAKAVEKGATAILVEELPTETPQDVVIVQVKNSAEALGYISANFYNHPSKELEVVGITGTNGKTTCATLLFDLFQKLGKTCGLLSTVRNRIGDEILDSTHTTPNAIAINALMRDMLNQGCTHCFMEVSSHALDQYRVTGLHFAGGVYTNISHDHLDYHETFNEYIKAKKHLFDLLPKGAFAMVNSDDKHSESMIANTKAKVHTYGLKTMSDYKGKVLESSIDGLHLNFDGTELYSQIIGDFNAYNLLAVYGVCQELGMDQIETLTAMSSLGAVDGRFQHFTTPGNITAVVDYAHTPDALENVLKTIESIRTGNEKLITVVGCGGDRDTSKRPLMAKIGSHYSTQLVLTSDNPRSEEPTTIINDMKAGLDPVELARTMIMEDRREAIKMACNLAQDGDIVLIAGKGHEKHQEIKGVKYPFDDFEIIQEQLKTLQK